MHLQHDWIKHVESNVPEQSQLNLTLRVTINQFVRMLEAIKQHRSLAGPSLQNDRKPREGKSVARLLFRKVCSDASLKLSADAERNHRNLNSLDPDSST